MLALLGAFDPRAGAAPRLLPRAHGGRRRSAWSSPRRTSCAAAPGRPGRQRAARSARRRAARATSTAGRAGAPGRPSWSLRRSCSAVARRCCSTLTDPAVAALLGGRLTGDPVDRLRSRSRRRSSSRSAALGVLVVDAVRCPAGRAAARRLVGIAGLRRRAGALFAARPATTARTFCVAGRRPVAARVLLRRRRRSPWCSRRWCSLGARGRAAARRSAPCATRGCPAGEYYFLLLSSVDRRA